MTRRRQVGTVRRLESGRWQARYHAADGSRFPAPGTFATKTEAARWLASIETDQSRGACVDPEAGKVVRDLRRGVARGEAAAITSHTGDLRGAASPAHPPQCEHRRSGARHDPPRQDHSGARPRL